MDLETRLEQKQTQRLILTPQMKQALHLLHLPLMELNTFLQQQIVENPLLETIEESRPKTKSAQDKDTEFEERIDNLMKLDEDKVEFFVNQYDQEWEKRRRYKEEMVTEIPILYKHLITQLNIFSQSELEKRIGEAIINNVDKNGYLRTPLDEIAKDLKVSLQDTERTLSLIQSFSPIGVGARFLSECLLLQLKHRGREHSLAAEIVKSYLPDLEKKRFEKIAKSLGASIDKVKKAFYEISRLEPKPGRSFGEERPTYIIPDIILNTSPDKYQIEFSNEDMPSFRISPYYKRLLRDKNTSEETKEYLKKKLNQALWLIRAVNRRQDTIRKVVECIIKIQKDFLDKGLSFVKPLTLKEVAQTIGINESTVSRAVANKYIATPHGAFQLRRFFNGGIKQQNGQRLSNENVKTRIKQLIDNETTPKPLSDEAVVKVLQSEGIAIARRTVTKYRKLLKIPPSNLRKER